MEGFPLSAITLANLFGVPDKITSNRGPQFTSNLWTELCNMLNILHRQTTAYHPEANGMVERLHRHLKDAICARIAAVTWAKEILWVLLGLHSQPREDTGLSPAEAVFGTPLVLCYEFLQAEEFPVDQIPKKFSKILNAPVFSLPSKHNLGRQLSEELPGNLLCSFLVWVH
jgi:hypothetical protein